MKRKDFLIILIPMFILTVLWVIFNVYHNLVTSTIKAPLSHQIISIEGKFDNETLTDVMSRKRILPQNEVLNETIVEIIPIDTIEAEISTKSSELISEEEFSSESGELLP